MKFEPGKSGNPGGRPKIPPEIKELVAEATPAAMRKIIRLVASKDERVALAAAQYVAVRHLGRPSQHIDADVRHDSLPALLAGILGGTQDAETLAPRPTGLRDRGVAGSA